MVSPDPAFTISGLPGPRIPYIWSPRTYIWSPRTPHSLYIWSPTDPAFTISGLHRPSFTISGLPALPSTDPAF
ncbi:unnamed protein product, partial [Staurois parvus]